ncbi:hypothetical protein P7C73_g6525, partial [Tremellales sp. Uapishka_1]
MNPIKRLFSTTSSRLSAVVPHESHLSPDDLHPTIYRIVEREIFNRYQTGASSSSSTLTIANPFLTHRIQKDLPSSSVAAQPSYTHVPPAIPRRRQKQLAEFCWPSSLPPTSSNEPSLPIKWHDGTMVSWAGDFKEVQSKGVYGGRRRMFKGHKHERERPAREKDIASRVAGMPKRIEEWKKVRHRLLLV